VVGIGASAGGLEAFTELLQQLPARDNVAYVLVQHLDPTHPSLLSELLAKTTSLPVREILDQTPVEAGHVHVIPPNCDLSIREGVLCLAPRAKNAGPARSIDHFLQSLAADQKAAAIGVILSGAGSDGAVGLKAIKEAGGITFAQDGATAKYDSMPRSAVATGCVDFVLSPAKIAEEIARLLDTPKSTKRRAAANARQRRGQVRPRKTSAALADGAASAASWPAAPEDLNLRKVFLLLRTRTGVDFSVYRLNTIRRRLARRLALHKLKALEHYVRFMREHPAEIDALYQDLLINVTSFFRNPSVFETLKRKVFPRLVKHSSQGDALRVWVAGCSTGQEPYSIAMAYAEFAEQSGNPLPIQIFASDINGAVLEQARAGRYTAHQVQSLSAARLQRFFLREADAFRVQKSIRDMVIFAQQNLLLDPPFTRVDLITCRNLLIYLEPVVQQKIIPAFHYALKPNGVLLLGSSESVGQFTSLFEPLDKGQKLYLKKPATSWLRYDRPPAVPATQALRLPPASAAAKEVAAVDALKEADRITLSKYAPASVLVAEDGEILQFRGDTRKYLELPSGKASFQLLKMAREGLALALQKAFHRAKKENKVVRERALSLDGRGSDVGIEIVPLKNLKDRCYLVLFEPLARAQPAVDGAANNGGNGRRNGHGTDGAKVDGNGANGGNGGAHALHALRQEFADTREHLATLQEQHDTSVEELQASNEEVQSANEELQSLNEELETSNEELESANEELTTLNEELATRNTELRESEQRLREQAQLLELAPVLVRSPKNRIIFWNLGAERLYGFTKEEALGQTSHLFLAAQFPEPLEKIEKELHRHGRWDGEVLHRRKDGQVICVASQWVVHHDNNHKVRAILEVNTDITARRKAEKALRESESFNRGILESSPDSIKVLDLAGRITYVSPAGVRLMAMPDAKACLDTYWPDLWDGGDRAEAEKAYRAALSGETVRFRGRCPTLKGEIKWWDVAVQPITGAGGRPERLLVVKRDITVQRVAEHSREEEARLALLRGDIATVVARTGETQPLLQQIAETLLRRLKVAGVRILTLRRGAPALELQASAGDTPPLSGLLVTGENGDFQIAGVAAKQQPFLSNQLADEPEFSEKEWAQRQRVIAFAGYPLLFETDTLGVVAVFSREPLESRILKELELAADSIAQFLSRKLGEEDRARLLHETLEARAEVEVLHEIGKTLSAELDLQKLTQAVTDAATRLAKAEFGMFYYNTTDEQGERYGLHALTGIPREAFENFPISSRTAVFGPVLEKRCVIRSSDISHETGHAHNETHAGLPTDQLRVKSYLAVPVISRSGEVIGALFLGHSRVGVFREREERLVTNLAAQAAVAMDNARLVDQLERKVDERTARLQETISELQAFSYTVSHDLRAPLRAMQSYAQVLLEDCSAELSEPARNYLTRIEHAGSRLDRLIQDVLTYSRISRSEVKLVPLDLDRLLHDVLQQYPMLQPPAAEIVVQGPLPRVLAEESSATQCFSNLLGNAVKFVPRDRQPRIVIRAEMVDARVRVWIEDNGIGIARGDHERIFSMFERVDSAGRYEGTGIGLAIVRKAIERMGGQVGLESEPGHGSRFWLEFQPAPP
jgi:two-component system CheB/CheR fusion protein